MVRLQTQLRSQLEVSSREARPPPSPTSDTPASRCTVFASGRLVNSQSIPLLTQAALQEALLSLA